MSAQLLDIEPPCLKTAASDEALKQELLSAHMPTTDRDQPRKGTKLYIISQIEHLCGTAGIPITETNRELTRKSKAELKGTLAHYMEKASLRRLRAQETITSPIVDDNASPNRAANVFILRMLHDTVLGGLEKVYESYGKPYLGYTISGLGAKLKDEPLTSQVDEILVQIAEESPELLNYFESPYAKLALCWLMAAVQVARKESDSKTKPNELRRRDRNVQTKPGHGAPTLVGGPEAIDGGKRVQFANLRPKKGGKELSDIKAADKTGGTGASGPSDPGLRRVGPLLQTDEQILRPSILLQGVASRTV